RDTVDQRGLRFTAVLELIKQRGGAIRCRVGDRHQPVALAGNGDQRNASLDRSHSDPSIDHTLAGEIQMTRVPQAGAETPGAGAELVNQLVAIQRLLEMEHLAPFEIRHERLGKNGSVHADGSHAAIYLDLA